MVYLIISFPDSQLQISFSGFAKSVCQVYLLFQFTMVRLLVLTGSLPFDGKPMDLKGVVLLPRGTLEICRMFFFVCLLACFSYHSD